MADFEDAAAFWGRRYATPEFVFGRAPAAFLAREAKRLPPRSSVLVPCDGEGRNSVWLAEQGHAVTAFDITAEGVEKARALASERNVEIDAAVASIDDWDWTMRYDAVVAVFVQFAGPARRARMFEEFAMAVQPGGLLMLHGYTPRQVDYGTGGPPHPENMYTPEMLKAAFSDWQIERLEAYEAELDEGKGHSGRSALIDLIGRKPQSL